MGRGPVEYQARSMVAETQVLLDLQEELAEIMLVGTLPEEPNWLAKQRRDGSEYSLRLSLVLEGNQIGLVRQLPGLLLARCADKCGFVDVDEAPLGCKEVA